MTLTRDGPALLQRLLQSPRLKLYAREIEDTLADEAERRQAFYAQLSEGDKAEFINGEVVMHSPVKYRHNKVGGNLYRLLSSYAMVQDLGYVGYEKILISLTRNDYEPDICFFAAEEAERFTADPMNFPAPSFIVEVLSDSTEERDRGVKFDDYAAHGVQEYWIIDPTTEIVEQYLLVGDQYELAIKANSGQLRSLTVTGFEIPVRALFDDGINIATLRTILHST